MARKFHGNWRVISTLAITIFDLSECVRLLSELPAHTELIIIGLLGTYTLNR